MQKKFKNIFDCYYLKLRFLRAYLLLKYFYKIKICGSQVLFDKGFSVYHGAKNIQIGNFVFLTDVLLNAGDKKGKIIIGDNVFFGHRCQVLARSHDYQKKGIGRIQTIIEKPVIIKEGAWIASGAIILPGVTVGKNAVVAAGSVVTKNVQNNCIVGGVPAKVIRKILF